MTPLLLVLIIGATARAVRLIGADTISEPFRDRWLTPGSWFETLFTCPWCLSMWIAPIVVACAYTCDWFVWPAAALTASHATGLLAGWE